MSDSKAALIVEYVRNVVIAFSGSYLNLTNSESCSMVQNVNEPFDLNSVTLPYTQIVAPIARPLTKTRDLERTSIDFSIQIFVKPVVDIGKYDSIEMAKYKQNIASDLRALVDKIERNQITDGSLPDCWMENGYQVTVEKSTLYSEPNDLYPPYMVTASFTLFFDEEFQS